MGEPLALGGHVARRALGRVGWAPVRASGQELAEEDGEDDLAGELAVRAAGRLRAQEAAQQGPGGRGPGAGRVARHVR